MPFWAVAPSLLPDGEGSFGDDIVRTDVACQTQGVLDLARFRNLDLHGGFTLVEVCITAKPLLDPLERAATAQTIIRGKRLHISLRSDLGESEASVSLYHEVLEAATVAAEHPPETVMEFNEGAFERAAQAAHARLGPAAPETLNQLYQFPLASGRMA